MKQNQKLDHVYFIQLQLPSHSAEAKMRGLKQAEKKTRRKNSTKIKKFMYKHKSIFFQMLLLTRDLEGRFGSHICSYFFGTATFSGKLLLKSNKHFLLFRSSYYLRATTFQKLLFFQSSRFFQAVIFSGKLLRRIDSSLGQLVFQNS